MSRYDYQSALDILKMVNVANDLLDVASYNARGIDAETGGDLTIVDVIGGIPRTPTFDEVKSKFVAPAILGAERYINLIEEFSRSGLYNANVGTVLTNMTEDPATLKAEILTMKNVVATIKANAAAVTDQAGLNQVADYIDANIIKIPLIRRKWNRAQGA